MHKKECKSEMIICYGEYITISIFQMVVAAVLDFKCTYEKLQIFFVIYYAYINIVPRQMPVLKNAVTKPIRTLMIFNFRYLFMSIFHNGLAAIFDLHVPHEKRIANSI